MSIYGQLTFNFLRKEAKMRIIFILMILTFLFVGFIAVRIQYKAPVLPVLPMYQEKFERSLSEPFQKKQLNPNTRRIITSC